MENNEKAIGILRQWVIKDTKGREHQITRYKPDPTDVQMLCRMRLGTKPANWQEVTPAVERAKQALVTTLLALEQQLDVVREKKQKGEK